MTVLSMEDPSTNGHIIYYYVGGKIYMHVIRPIDPYEDESGKTVWSDYIEIQKDYRDMEFEEKSLKWARLRGVNV